MKQILEIILRELQDGKESGQLEHSVETVITIIKDQLDEIYK